MHIKSFISDKSSLYSESNIENLKKDCNESLSNVLPNSKDWVSYLDREKENLSKIKKEGYVEDKYPPSITPQIYNYRICYFSRTMFPFLKDPSLLTGGNIKNPPPVPPPKATIDLDTEWKQGRKLSDGEDYYNTVSSMYEEERKYLIENYKEKKEYSYTYSSRGEGNKSLNYRGQISTFKEHLNKLELGNNFYKEAWNAYFDDILRNNHSSVPPRNIPYSPTLSVILETGIAFIDGYLAQLNDLKKTSTVFSKISGSFFIKGCEKFFKYTRNCIKDIIEARDFIIERIKYLNDFKKYDEGKKEGIKGDKSGLSLQEMYRNKKKGFLRVVNYLLKLLISSFHSDFSFVSKCNSESKEWIESILQELFNTVSSEQEQIEGKLKVLEDEDKGKSDTDKNKNENKDEKSDDSDVDERIDPTARKLYIFFIRILSDDEPNKPPENTSRGKEFLSIRAKMLFLREYYDFCNLLIKDLEDKRSKINNNDNDDPYGGFKKNISKFKKDSKSIWGNICTICTNIRSKLGYFNKSKGELHTLKEDINLLLDNEWNDFKRSFNIKFEIPKYDENKSEYEKLELESAKFFKKLSTPSDFFSEMDNNMRPYFDVRDERLKNGFFTKQKQSSELTSKIEHKNNVKKYVEMYDEKQFPNEFKETILSRTQLGFLYVFLKTLPFDKKFLSPSAQKEYNDKKNKYISSIETFLSQPHPIELYNAPVPFNFKKFLGDKESMATLQGEIRTWINNNTSEYIPNDLKFDKIFGNLFKEAKEAKMLKRDNNLGGNLRSSPGLPQALNDYAFLDIKGWKKEVDKRNEGIKKFKTDEGTKKSWEEQETEYKGKLEKLNKHDKYLLLLGIGPNSNNQGVITDEFQPIKSYLQSRIKLNLIRIYLETDLFGLDAPPKGAPGGSKIEVLNSITTLLNGANGDLDSIIDIIENRDKHVEIKNKDDKIPEDENKKKFENLINKYKNINDSTNKIVDKIQFSKLNWFKTDVFTEVFQGKKFTEEKEKKYRQKIEKYPIGEDLNKILTDDKNLKIEDIIKNYNNGNKKEKLKYNCMSFDNNDFDKELSEAKELQNFFS